MNNQALGKNMAECKFLNDCQLFDIQMMKLPGTTQLYKNHYCRSHYSNCARYMVYKACGEGHSPLDLYPNQVERVPEIVDSVKAAE